MQAGYATVWLRQARYSSPQQIQRFFIHLVARSHQDNPLDRLAESLKQVTGAYALLCVMDDMLVGVRDPHGIRPLILGKVGDAYVLASETCA